MYAIRWLSRTFRTGRAIRLGAVLMGGMLAACTAGDGTGPVGPGSAQAQRCAPDNAYARDARGTLLSGYRDGTRALEKEWLAAYLQQNYLWYQEIEPVDPNAASYNTGTHFELMNAYFKAMLSQAKLEDDQPKDRHSFIYPTADWNQLSQAGVVLGYGVVWRVASSTAPRGLRIAAIQPGSQAEQVGLVRGDTLVSVTVDGVTAGADATAPAQVDALNKALYPTERGKLITLELRSVAGRIKTVSATATETTSQPVLVSRVLDVGNRRVGYMNLMDFVAPAESQMVRVFEEFSGRNVQDLVIDLRYNGGGYLYLSSQLAYMIAGSAATRNRVFDRLEYNDKRSSENVDTPFYDTTTGSSGSNTVRGNPLPSLNLRRVTVLATQSTCSASEALVNGLRGIGVTVDLVGSKTCGKPYGFTQKDNCGLSYFPIEFRGVNARGEGDYASGMAVNCAANDDLASALGDVGEGMLAAALSYRASGTCPAPKSTVRADDEPEGRLLRLPIQEGLFLRPGIFE